MLCRAMSLTSLLLLGVMAPAVVSVASAHHSAAASYEADHSITITGQVLKLAWTNPHCHVYIDVTEGPFKGRMYAVELSSPGALVNDGWTKTFLQPGDRVAIAVHPSRVGAPIGLCRHCLLTINGKTMKPRGTAAASSGANGSQYSRIRPADVVRISLLTIQLLTS